MRPFSSLVIAAVMIILFFLFTCLWKTATKEDLPLAHLACSRPYVEYIPNSYIVFVPRRYYTLAEHKQAVAYTFDLDACLSEMNEEPTLGGFHYSATLNADELAAVRAAPGVSHVECNRHLKLPGPLEDAPWIAPLRPRCAEDGAVLKSYLVHLYSGYPLQDHKKKVARRGFDLDAAIKLVHPPSEDHELSYSADFDEETLAAVRKDVGVVLVQCQPGIQNVGWEGEQGVL